MFSLSEKKKKELIYESDKLLSELFPLCRSLTGEGLRTTLKKLNEITSFKIKEFKSGKEYYDWKIPDEWIIREAFIRDSKGNKIIDFKDNNLLNSYKNIKGLKYILNGFQNSQTEISNFISKCKENENEKGFLKQTFFEFKLKKHYKFISGPFANQIFQIIDLQKNKLNILIGKINTSIKKEEFLFQPI